MLHLLALAAALGLLSPWLVTLLADHSQHLAWLLDLASHWQWLHLALLLGCLVLLAPRRPRWLLLAPLLALPWFSVAPMLPAQTGEVRLELRLVSANLQQSDDAAALRAWLDAQPADLVLLQEVTPALARQQGEFYSVLVGISRTGRPDTSFIAGELDYIAKFAIHKAKKLEEELWSVVGVGELTDTTEATLFRLGIPSGPR